jgi:2-methylcitrate dehydratase
MAPVSREMAQFAYRLQFEDIPQEAIYEAKRFLLDSMGCALAAVHNRDIQAMYRYIERLGGTPEATVIGKSLRTNAPNAALMNCLLTRALDYNDIYWQQDPSHPSDLIGVALAVAEANGKNGRDVLIAIIIAYELVMRWCHAAKPGIREVGWHHATLTQFVSPLVAGRLYDLDIDQLAAAVGISGSCHFTLGGVVAGHLTNMKNTADPLSSQAGVFAAMMASEGYAGPVEVIEGKEGLVEVISNVKWNTHELLNGLGDEFLITKCSYKAFPSEALTHQPITATLNLCREHKIAAEDVEDVLVETTTRGADILADQSKYNPETKDTADHSLPYVVAVAIADGSVLPSSFSEERIQDPKLKSLMKKINVVPNSEIDALFPQVKRARITITVKSGLTYSAQTDVTKGDPENPLSDEEIIAKFRANTEGILGHECVDKIINATWQLDSFGDISKYMSLFNI